MNDVIKKDLPRPAGSGDAGSGRFSLPPHLRCVRLANEPANYETNGHRYSGGSDITYYHQSFLMADGRILMSGTHNNNTLAQAGANGNVDNLKEMHIRCSGGDASSLMGKPVALWQAYDNTVVLTDKGDVAVWGYNGHGQHARNNTSGQSTIVPIDGSDIGPRSGVANREVVKIEITKGYPTASNTIFALCKDGTVWRWGYNGYGQLCQGNTTSYSRPVQLKLSTSGNPAVTDAVDVFAGHGSYQGVFVLRSNGELWSAGQNSWGKLGNGSTSNRNRLYKCTNLPTGLAPSDYVSVMLCGSQRGAGTAVLLKDGRCYTAGYGGHYFHGNTNSNQSNFRQLNYPSGVTGYKKIWTGGEYSQLWLWGDDDRLWATGYNGTGQLGVGNTSSTSGPRECNAGGWTNYGASDGGSSVGTNYTNGYVEYGKWEPYQISTGGAYDGSTHRHTSIMWGSDNFTYGAGTYGGYGGQSTSSQSSWRRHVLPFGFTNLTKFYDEDGTGTSPDRPEPGDIQFPREPGFGKNWEIAGIVAHGYTSQFGAFIRLKNGMVYAVGRNTSNKLGIENNDLNAVAGPQKVRFF